MVLGSEGLGCARTRRARAEGLASRCGCSAPLARGCSALPRLLSGCSHLRRVRDLCDIDVYVKCLFFMLTLSLFLLYGTNVSLPFVGLNRLFLDLVLMFRLTVRMCGFAFFSVSMCSYVCSDLAAGVWYRSRLCFVSLGFGQLV